MYQIISSFGTRCTLLRYGGYHSLVRRLPPFGTTATTVWYSCYQAVVLGRLPGGTALKKRDGKVLAVGEAKEIIACVF
ncbi:hypothetical protein F9954_16245 [Bacteroides stercoris]|uniref:Uncharacterized protein n=1 Tax=Bacteroides stercoris TaxID=46506 RepID=A0A6A2J3A5_BACSE|nr:hypothetical protein F9968_05655 [Bacteroides stercoris]KAB5263874.1 hypothetical protein F9966_05100 [Bacteroides stercoris]KAB5265363.1 hypothetical protein F9952_16025 [Bacteroides stercoris]KAB5268807.1 hypothetical protein F9964_19245 [Bacteroides stercoris]KAB5272853.1 hypothetical protein F9953_15825 [Bacteroides stercoris]